MLRVRSEKRRMRHVEVLRRQKQEEEDVEETLGGGRSWEESDKVFRQSSEPQAPSAPASRSPDSRKTGSTQSQVIMLTFKSLKLTILMLLLSVSDVLKQQINETSATIKPFFIIIFVTFQEETSQTGFYVIYVMQP